VKPDVVVPIHLGCCVGPARCLLCPPAPEPPTPELVRALVDAARESAPRGARVEVRFFGGPPPSDSLLRAAAGSPITVRVRPDALTRAEAQRLRQAGVGAIELDALSLDPAALRGARRAYRAARVLAMGEALTELGFDVGGVLAPGLPGSSFAGCVADARAVVGRWRFVRLHPVLVLAGSGLRERHERGLYGALDLHDAVGIAAAMLDVLDEGGVPVIRVGLHARHDVPARAVAGPHHPAFRELVEALRTLGRLRAALVGPIRPDDDVVVRCHPADEARTRGPLHDHVRTLRAELALRSLAIVPDPTLARGALRVEVTESAR
jgi:hypothetical protein